MKYKHCNDFLILIVELQILYHSKGPQISEFRYLGRFVKNFFTLKNVYFTYLLLLSYLKLFYSVS